MIWKTTTQTIGERGRREDIRKTIERKYINEKENEEWLRFWKWKIIICVKLKMKLEGKYEKTKR